MLLKVVYALVIFRLTRQDHKWKISVSSQAIYVGVNQNLLSVAKWELAAKFPCRLCFLVDILFVALIIEWIVQYLGGLFCFFNTV